MWKSAHVASVLLVSVLAGITPGRAAGEFVTTGNSITFYVRVTGMGLTYDGDGHPAGGTYNTIDAFYDSGFTNQIATYSSATDVAFATYFSDPPGGAASALAGADTVLGSPQDDALFGGAGADTLAGGEGSDRYLFATLDVAPGESIYDTGTSGTDSLVVLGAGVNFPAGALIFGIEQLDLRLAQQAAVVFDASQFSGGQLPANLAVMGNPAALQIIFVMNVGTFDATQWTFDGWGSASGLVILGTTTGPNSIDGSQVNDIIGGGDGVDHNAGYDGNDSLDGGGGNDLLAGDDGIDRLVGGNDVLVGGAGNDILDGNGGIDVLSGDADDDELFGGYGIDLLRGGDGSDELRGGYDDDVLDGGAGNDWIHGSDDRIPFITDGNDALDGGAGNDRLFGGRDNDGLHGGAGKDQLDGEEGNDVLFSGRGKDILTGGTGHDVFEFSAVSDSVRGPGHDAIMDFNVGWGKDVINFRPQTNRASLALQRRRSRCREIARENSVA